MYRSDRTYIENLERELKRVQFLNEDLVEANAKLQRDKALLRKSVKEEPTEEIDSEHYAYVKEAAKWASELWAVRIRQMGGGDNLNELCMQLACSVTWTEVRVQFSELVHEDRGLYQDWLVPKLAGHVFGR